MDVCRYMNIHFVNTIVTQQAGITPLHIAASAEVVNAKAVNALLQAGFKVDEKSQVSMFWK